MSNRYERGENPTQYLSRRGFLRGALGGILIGFAGDESRSQKSPTVEAFERGFVPLTLEAFKTLQFQYSEPSVECLQEIPTNRDILLKSTFNAQDGQPTFHRITSTPNKNVSLHMIRATVDEGSKAEQHYIVPLVRSKTSGMAEVLISGLPDGKHTVTFHQDHNAPVDKNTLQYGITMPDTDSVLGSIYARTPAIALGEPQLNPLGMNAPVFSVMELQHNEATKTYEFTNVVAFTGEKGGYSVGMREELFGRSYDVQWAYKGKLRDGKSLSSDGGIFLVYGDINAYFEGGYLDRQPLLRVADDHNNFNAKVVSQPLLYSPRPEFLTPGMTTAELLNKHTELEILAKNNAKLQITQPASRGFIRQLF